MSLLWGYTPVVRSGRVSSLQLVRVALVEFVHAEKELSTGFMESFPETLIVFNLVVVYSSVE